MTTALLLADLRRDEGLRLAAYPDPLSGGAPWTIGYGHTGPEVHEGLDWTLAEAEAALARDLARICRALDAHLPWWRSLDDVRQDVIANMAFNLGVGKLEGFAAFLAFVRSGKFVEAALDLHGTAWFRQVGARAQRLVEQLATGAHP